MSSTHTEAHPTAVLVGIQTPDISSEDLQSSLDELSRLVTTLGYRVVGRLWQKRKSNRSLQILGDGKLKELSEWTGGSGVIAPGFVKKKHKAALKFEDLADETAEDSSSSTHAMSPTERATHVIFDCELSPSQLRNIESATGASALDRTGVIIEIFSRHARTRAARLQVEIARLAYVAPRLRETGGDEDRGGGGVGAKGAGETSLELDRRSIRDRIKELKDELAAMSHEHEVRRARRNQELTVALVGYTNAGKSSLMRALTGSEVLVADKLFATLDTTVRLLHPETRPRILISDTVGFIKKLPHDLVASFKSTLDEALNASLLLYVVDASDPTFRSQLEVTKTVLAEVGVDQAPSRLVLNKIDRISEFDLKLLRQEFPEAIMISAIDSQDISRLRETLIETFESDMVDEEFMIPYAARGIIGEIRDRVKVLNESYDATGLTIRVRGPIEKIEALRALVKKQSAPHL